MTALFVRIPAEHAKRLDRAAFQLRMPQAAAGLGLLERYVDPDSPSSLAGLDVRHPDTHSARRITVQAIDPDGLAVGHHSFHPQELEVLDCEEAAELLRIESELVQSMASAGELPGRQLAASGASAVKRCWDGLPRIRQGALRSARRAPNHPRGASEPGSLGLPRCH
ncbi:MAG: hypothetical protein ACRDK2_06690 [Solirubrobacteraceae bacterium]